MAGLSRYYRSAEPLPPPYKSHNAKRGWFVLVFDVIMQWVYCEEISKYKCRQSTFFPKKEICPKKRGNTGDLAESWNKGDSCLIKETWTHWSGVCNIIYYQSSLLVTFIKYQSLRNSTTNTSVCTR